MSMRPRLSILLLVTATAACANQKAVPSSPPASVAATPTGAGATWIGRWAGVEGTFLELARDGDRYVVTIADLDGPKSYAGVAAGDHIEFTRGGKTESIRAASGAETGMKWLADETNCLVVTVGSEGYCRK